MDSTTLSQDELLEKIKASEASHIKKLFKAEELKSMASKFELSYLKEQASK
jgi:hypothetical protein